MFELWEAICLFVKKMPNEPVIIGHDETLTWSALQQRVNSLSKELDRFSGQVLALYADNSPDWIAVDLACHIANVTLLPLPRFFSKQQLTHAIKQSGATAIIMALYDDRYFESKLLGHIRGKPLNLSSSYSKRGKVKQPNFLKKHKKSHSLPVQQANQKVCVYLVRLKLIPANPLSLQRG